MWGQVFHEDHGPCVLHFLFLWTLIWEGKGLCRLPVPITGHNRENLGQKPGGRYRTRSHRKTLLSDLLPINCSFCLLIQTRNSCLRVSLLSMCELFSNQSLIKKIVTQPHTLINLTEAFYQLKFFLFWWLKLVGSRKKVSKQKYTNQHNLKLQAVAYESPEVMIVAEHTTKQCVFLTPELSFQSYIMWHCQGLNSKNA